MRDQSKPPRFPELDEAEQGTPRGQLPPDGHDDVLDEPPSAEELQLAASLASALENRAAAPEARGPAAPDNANALGALLETATLVTASRRLELAPERQASLRAELDRSLAKRAERPSAPKRPRLHWWLPFPLAAALLGSLFLARHRFEQAPEASVFAPGSPSMGQPKESDPGPLVAEAPVTHLAPSDGPPKELLRAQAKALAAAARSRSDSNAQEDVEATRQRLDLELRAYRSRLIASLDERLGGATERGGAP